MSWLRITMDNGEHVVPEDEVDDHDALTTCKCGPRVKHEDGTMIILHNSFDGREAVEWAKEVLDGYDNKQRY